MLDIGQVEGGFVFGLGYHLTEKMRFDPNSGEALTAGTWVSRTVIIKERLLALIRDLFTFSCKVIKMFILV
jgi:xanthine dehydrogenase molybdopterin-binding subunit B